MIVFINLKGQIYNQENESYFAFFDTVTDRFCTFSNNQIWKRKADFIVNFSIEEVFEEFSIDRVTNKKLDEFMELIPNDFFDN